MAREKIIEVNFGEERPEVTRRRGPPDCLHRQKILDDNDRTLRCRSCGVELDLYDAMRSIAIDQERQIEAKQAHEQANKRVRELEGEEKRVKARVKNAGKKDAEEAVLIERRRNSELAFRIHKKQEEARKALASCERATQQLLRDCYDAERGGKRKP